ncbi:hypothetical protein AAG570_008719 [Ranatra chinensis]|uniref:Histone deacetylase n=1 Tax=Ranatra chinensis TaxID=642074 RepID=A0ABD0Z2E1_9HEMI
MEVDVYQECNSKKRKNEDQLVKDKYLPQVGIVYDEKLFQISSKVPQLNHRADMVHELIKAYDLLRNMTIYEYKPATDTDINSFHSFDFIEYLKMINNLYTEEDDIDLEYGFGYDCPPLDGIYDYVCAIVGSTLSAARALIRKEVDIAINWCGGWHHAQRDLVEGFCYVNDIVIAILELRTAFDKVLYVDLDIHHCNGVQDSFAYTKKVLTLSFHKFEPGFYPCTGDVTDIGFGRGQYYTVNVPLSDGITDVQYCSLFDRIIKMVKKGFPPDAIVVQCGADGLAGDPLGGFNLTPKAYGHCVKTLMDFKKPTLILGGGGYNLPNTAKCWTYITSVIIGCELHNDIPEHEYFTNYGPSYELAVSPNNRKDNNEPSDIQRIVDCVKGNIKIF